MDTIVDSSFFGCRLVRQNYSNGFVFVFRNDDADVIDDRDRAVYGFQLLECDVLPVESFDQVLPCDL